ncbi:MAG: hypothetical protein M1814_005238 [Vezdaea aestivalis]|nr:MAG: hypothetical protein M1814_005238 [Vezdaea aestivalis]
MSKTTTIGFGTGIEHGSLRQPELSGEFNLLRKRQSSTASRTVPTNFPPPPTGTPTVGNSSKADVSFSFVNKSILPPEINGIPAQAIAIPNTVFKCLNCTATGQIEVKHGLITLQGDFDVARAANDPLDFIQEGFVEVDVRQLRASIDLETTVSGNIPLAQWSLGLPTVPLSPFTIAGVASIGPIFAPVLEGSVQVASQLAVTYGFDVSVPDNSSLKFDILNASNSKIVGFNQSSLKAHPVSVNISEPTLTLSAAFKPQVLIGISIAGQRAGLGVFANLPRLQVDIKQLSNVNKKCERTNTTQNATGIIDEALGLFTGNLTHIMPSINLDIGLTENVDLTFLDPIQSEVVLFSATDLVPLPTACMSWNKKHAALTTIDARNTGQANPPDPDITTTASPSIANKSPSVPIASATESKKASEGDVISVKLKATWAVFALANIFIATMI